MAIDDAEGGEADTEESADDATVSEAVAAAESESESAAESDQGSAAESDQGPAAESGPDSAPEAESDVATEGDEPDAGVEGDDADEADSVTRAVGEYTWEDFKEEYYYDSNGNAPSNTEFTPEKYLGFDPDDVDEVVGGAGLGARQLTELANERTVRVNPELDEDAFFTDANGATTVVNRYDLEKAVPMEKKHHFREVDRYWVNKPYAFVIIFHSEKENEKKYYVVEPYLTPVESDLKEFLSGKLKTAIKYSSDDVIVQGGEEARAQVIEDETHDLLRRYDLYASDAEADGGEHGVLDEVKEIVGMAEETTTEYAPSTHLDGVEARPEPALIEEDAETLSEHQIEKLLYLLKRDFIGFERIDGIKHDINVEDISCDGYNSPVFVYHSDYEQVITNIYHGEEELDEFVVKMAQRSGKGISKRSPQVDATLPDGSRSQLTLGKEVSDHGTNYTIRQFKDVPFTPIDLINWNTFSLNEMAFLWLCIENHKSLIFAGGTASGKTTSLNAVSLFIPSKAKIVSIEDTREVELPQRNWIASVTRPSFSEGDKGDVDEFDLLEAALRQRPEYIVMGEIRGEEGRTLFQVMSTGHTTLTTFHADSVGEVIKRFTTDPINVSKTMFTALDLVSIQTQTRVQGNKVRRNKSLTEINHYDPENDEINVQDVYQWQAETDEFLQMGESNTLDEIMFDRGWGYDRVEDEVFMRELVLAYLIDNGLNTYTQVAATLQAFINDPETILTLIANDDLERSLEDLREMESVKIDIDPSKEAMVPRPSANEEMLNETREILDEADDMLEEYRNKTVEQDIAGILEMNEAEDIDVSQEVEESGEDDEGSEFGGFAFEAEGESGAADDGEATADGGEMSGDDRQPGTDRPNDTGSDEYGTGSDEHASDSDEHASGSDEFVSGSDDAGAESSDTDAGSDDAFEGSEFDLGDEDGS